MSQGIILTAADVAKLRANAKQTYGVNGWITSPGNALEPVPLKDGTFMLPAEVITDPAHAAQLDAFKLDAKVAIDLTDTKKQRDVVTATEVFLSPEAITLQAADAIAIDVVDVAPDVIVKG